MRTVSTVVFADLSGSTALYELLGNERASQAVTRLMRWMGALVQAQGGRVVKELGDGVLSVFSTAAGALAASAEMQRRHQINMAQWPEQMRLPIRIGVATGEVVELAGDTYGDAVNVASRMCERALAHEIWATDTAVQGAATVQGVRFRRLGKFDIRGKSEALLVYQVVWQSEETQGAWTDIAELPSAMAPVSSRNFAIALHWAAETKIFKSVQMPVQLGRSRQVECVVLDSRVSRIHAAIDWREGSFTLSDLSSFGTWVQFADASTDLRLRRDTCVLHGSGRISLGSPFGSKARTVDFRIQSWEPAES